MGETSRVPAPPRPGYRESAPLTALATAMLLGCGASPPPDAAPNRAPDRNRWFWPRTVAERYRAPIEGPTPCLQASVDLGSGPADYRGRTGRRLPTQENLSEPEGGGTAFLWTAAGAGEYVLDTFGSAEPSIRHMVRADCPAWTPAPCRFAGGRSQVCALEAGARLVVVVEGSAFTDDFGDSRFELHVRPRQAAETECFDNADEDGDGAPDCADADCAADARCGGTACAEVDLGSAASAAWTDTLDGTRNRFVGTCAGGAFPERVFRWQAPRAGRFVAEILDDDFLPALYVRRGSCIGPEAACRFNEESYGVAVAFDAAAGEDFVVFVDSADDETARIRATSGFTLLVRPHAEETGSSCRNYRDDDGDGQPDWDDESCRDPAPP